MNNNRAYPGQHASLYKRPDYSAADVIRIFGEFVEETTGATQFDLVADGQLHRFDDPHGRHGNHACWYVLHLDGLPSGVVGNWRTGVKATWCAERGQRLLPVDRAQMQSTLRIAREQREKHARQKQEAARSRALYLWKAGEPAAINNPYLVKKRISGHGLRTLRTNLLVPLVDTEGNLQNLQTIQADGVKRFLPGGRVTGCFCLLGAAELPFSGSFYIAEGVATTATVHMETGVPAAAAMNAGNLKVVAQGIARARPDLVIIIAADNDHATYGNPGMTKGLEAAAAIRAGLTWPRLSCGEGCACTDFNDAANCGRYQR